MLSDAPYPVRFVATLLLAVIFTALLVGIARKRHVKGLEKRLKWYHVVAALLLIWAGTDLFHYIFIGREIVAHYADISSVQEMVRGLLLQGAVKAALGVGVLAAGWFFAKERPPIRSLAAVTLLLSGLVLGLWGVSMGLITATAAEFGAYQVQSASADQASTLSDMLEFNLDRKDSLANGQKIAFWETVSTDTPSIRNYMHSHDDHFLHLWEDTDFYSATAIYDSEGSLLSCSWQDSLYLQYMTEAEWDAGEDMGKHQAIAYLDQAHLTVDGKQNMTSTGLRTWALRLTGSFDGTTFLPVRIEGVLYDDVQAVLWEKGSGTYILSNLIEDYDLPWYLLYEDSEAMETQSDTVTLYADYMRANWREDTPAFFYKGERYPDLVALMEEMGPSLVSEAPVSPSQYQWRDLVQISVSYRLTYEGNTYWTSYYPGEDGYLEGAPEMQCYLVNMVYASPLWDAVVALRQIYLLTLALAAALVLVGRSVLRRQLIRPAQSVSQALLKGDEQLDCQYTEEWRWQEGKDLREGFLNNRDRCQAQRNELTRLNTALTYAKTAEENRRQMTSHIAHELKTPLAVVHSYAEGLKEHIAEDKRDKYVDVILSETERMDAMVLEMLDLSRLEAGKVKLARDQFSLGELAESVFDRLEKAIEAKDLHLTCEFPEDTTVTADESRIAQVVENFATNAVKYTPAGGNITVAITRNYRGLTFTVANDCPPLPQEALDKVWDTFYRVDEARSGGGTGLGLAIAKQIIELHGGTCAAENTKTGVAFRFTLP